MTLQPCRFLILTLGLLFGHLCMGDNHPFNINEVFSSADGKVQYIELTHSGNSQSQQTSFSLQSHYQGISNTFSFHQVLRGDTVAETLLLATAEFSSHSGINPDRIFPDGFIPVGGGSLSFADSDSEFTFSRTDLPLNGQQALGQDLEAVAATPANSLGLTTQLDVASWAHFDESLSQLSIPELLVRGSGLANLRFDVDLATMRFTLIDDYFFYKNGIVAGTTPAELQEESLYIPAMQVGTELYELRLQILEDEQVVLGEAEILGVEPAIAISPQTALSINRGSAFYAGLCAYCHGDQGEGASASAIADSPNYRNFVGLRNVIASIMPFDEPGLCLDSGEITCATDVANYVLYVLQQQPE